jgi:hypothetical protein
VSSPASAIAWELGWRHRWGLAATLAYFLVIAGLFQVVGVDHLAHALGSALGTEALSRGELEVQELGKALGLLGAAPLTFGLLHLLIMFGYGPSTDLAMRESNFPARMFTLPVRTATLVAWPMAYGTATVALTVAATVGCVLWPCGVAAPLGPLAALAATLLAWIQAVCWSPSRAAWLRAVVAGLVLMIPVAAVMFGLLFEVPTLLLTAGLLGSLPAAYAVALVGVARARRGDIPEWPRWSRWVEAVGRRLPRRRRPFTSAAGAQLWFEWRRHGATLPFTVSLVLATFLLWLGFLALNDQVPSAGVLIAPAFFLPLLAGLVGGNAGKMDPWVRGSYGVPAFTAVRPMTSGALVGAKLKMAALSTLAAWVLVLLWVPAALLVSGGCELPEWLPAALQQHPLRLVAGSLLGLGGLVFLTWKCMVEALYVNLTGRPWVTRVSSGVWSGRTVALGTFGAWLYYHPDYQGTFFAALPWLLGAAAVVKLLATGWMCRAAWRRGLLSGRTLVGLLSLWLLIAVGLTVLLYWLVPGDAVPVGFLVPGVVLFLPLTRLAAAPLALEWNRHR